MATDTAPEFDLGPLSWVQGEIDQALTRGIEGLAAFKAAPQDSSALKHARTHIHQAAGAIQMVGLDAVTAYTDEIERQLATAGGARSARSPGELRADRPCLPQAEDLFGRGGRRGRSGTPEAVSRIRTDAAGARGQGRGADGPVLSGSFTAGSPDRQRQVGHAAETAVLPGQAAAAVPARPAGMAARRRGGRAGHARCRSGHRGRADAFGTACLLVGGRRAARRHRRKRGRERIRREATLRACRLADPALRRRLGEGRRPDAPRGALLCRHQRPGRAAGAGSAAGVPSAGPDPDGGRALRRRRARAAASARGARPAGNGEGSLAQADRRPGRESAQTQADPVHPARQVRRHRRTVAVETRHRAGQSPGQAAQRRDPRRRGDGVRDRPAACRVPGRELCQPLA